MARHAPTFLRSRGLAVKLHSDVIFITAALNSLFSNSLGLHEPLDSQDR